MARVANDGLEYFPLDVTFLDDTKIRRIMRKHGALGTVVVIAIFSEIYKTDGYFIFINDDLIFSLSEQCMCTEKELRDVLDSAILYKLFSRKLYDEKRVLTSRGIQRQWTNIVKKARRANQTIDPKYRITTKDDSAADILEGMPITAEGMPQSKVKKSKVKRDTNVSLVEQARLEIPEMDSDAIVMDEDPVSEIIEYLNMRTGSKHRASTKKTASMIHARLKEKYTVQNFKDVIDKKCVEWMGGDFEKYLVPATLFCESHFDSYLNQPVRSPPQPKEKQYDASGLIANMRDEGVTI
jgi:uncharacterized phage protein (TIGR02220 family)